MMTPKEIERAYAKLMNDVATKDFYKVDLTNRINTYTCGMGHSTVTIDRDAGVTAMFLACPYCGIQASSAGYRPQNKESLKPTHEWVRPTLEECLRAKNVFMLDHVLKGGLEFRQIKY